MTYVVNLISHFWRKELSTLFDYESNEISTSFLEINNTCILLREGRHTKMSNLKCDKKTENYIANILRSNENVDDYFIHIDGELYSRPEESNPRVASDNWILLNNSYSKDNAGFKLREGDIIKLGKVVFRVKELSINPTKNNNEFGGNENTLNLNNVHNTNFDRLTVNDEIRNEDENDEIRNEDENNEIRNEDEEMNENEENTPRELSQIQHQNNILNSNINNQNNFTVHSPNLSYNTNFNNNNDFSIHTNVKSNNLFLHNTHKNKMEEKQVNKKSIQIKQNQLIRLNYNNQLKNENQCKICLGDNLDDMLINICKCTGSVKYIHLSCVRKWLISKLTIKTINHLTIYSYSLLECELCKSEIPDKLSVKGKMINTITTNNVAEYLNLPKFMNYVALECIKDKPLPISGEEDKKTVYIINMKDKLKLKIGRSSDSDVRMTDSSVSRNHIYLSIIKQSLYLQDNNSKFGTHINININQSIPLLPNRKLALQLGKCYLIIKMVRTCISYLCCKKSNSQFLHLQDYNDAIKLILKQKEVNDTLNNPKLANEEILNANNEDDKISNIDDVPKLFLNNSKNMIMESKLVNYNVNAIRKYQLNSFNNNRSSIDGDNMTTKSRLFLKNNNGSNYNGCKPNNTEQNMINENGIANFNNLDNINLDPNSHLIIDYEDSNQNNIDKIINISNNEKIHMTPSFCPNNVRDLENLKK